jgi:hypothetical protein
MEKINMTLNEIVSKYNGNYYKKNMVKEIKQYVLSLLHKERPITSAGESLYMASGYNQCLADIKERIEKEMGK